MLHQNEANNPSIYEQKMNFTLKHKNPMILNTAYNLNLRKKK